jgi:hypothetical protein
MSGVTRSIAGFVAKHRDLLVILLAALVVRLVWNLQVHPPMSPAYTVADMGGYVERARTSIDHPDEPRGYFTLFPWGTHWLLSLVMRVFGKDNGAAIDVLYAVLGAGAVGYGFAIARRLTRSVRVSRVVGVVLVFYYPWIGLGGYVLSEPPFTLFLCATVFHALVYADRGRPRDAWLFGCALTLATLFRPQILAALPLYGILVLVRRRSFRRVRLKVIAPAVVAPLALLVIVSAARVHFHTGHYGFVAGNGPLNFAFGRCHATTILAFAPDRNGGYSPPSLGALGRRDAEQPGAFFKLDPAMGTKLSIEGHTWDAAPLNFLARECIQKTGPARQARYALTHLALLWFFNTAWPDQNHAVFRAYMETSQNLHDVFVLPAALVAAALAFQRRRARWMLLALHVLALMAVAMIYFGDTRLRTPYDGLLVTLAAVTYASAGHALARWWTARGVAGAARQKFDRDSEPRA